LERSRPVLQLSVGQFSHPGRKRSNNEDWLGKFQPDDAERLSQKGSLFLVADGMGGHRSGELASRRAVDQVIRNYVDDPVSDVGASLRRAIELANAALYAEAQRRDRDPSRRGPGTTLVAAVVRSGELWIANVGDSRAYLLRNGKLRQLSRDHVLYPAGEEDGAPAGKWIGRHVITRALGRKPNVEVDIFPPLELRDGDRVLLCSDGLTTPLSDEEIRDIGSRYPPPKAAEALVQAANERGGPDNVSVIVLGIASQKTTPGRDGPQNTLEALTSPDAWRSTLETIRQFISDGDQGFRSPVFLAVVLLVILVLIGLGFVLGLILF
jgi:serine/threonine protein phosphatase PrpC